MKQAWQVINELKEFLSGRSGAYRRVFNQESVDVKIVEADLAKFCRAFDSTGDPDPYLAARLDGRREVWLRIQEHLNLTTDELYTIYSEGKKRGH